MRRNRDSLLAGLDIQINRSKDSDDSSLVILKLRCILTQDLCKVVKEIMITVLHKVKHYILTKYKYYYK